MAVKQYVGSRYVPVFANPIDWSDERTYEPLTIVYYQGNSYTSKQAVPLGIDIANETYWALTGNYNAQIEQYRTEVQQYEQQVQAFDGRITANAQGIVEANESIANETSQREQAVSAEAQSREQGDASLQTQINDIVSKKTLVVLGDSWASPSASNTWMQSYADIKGLNLKNYAVSGAGFIAAAVSTNLISAQVTTARNDGTVNKDDVIEVIVIGGVNDYRNDANAADAGSAVVDVMTDLMEIYPNAICKYYLNGYEYGYPTSWIDSFIPNAFNDAFYSSLALLSGLFLNAYAFNSSNLLHPTTETGQNVIVKELLNQSSLGKFEYTRQVNVTSSQNNCTATVSNVYRLPTGCLLRLEVKITGNISEQTTLTIDQNYKSLLSRFQSVISWFGSSASDFTIGTGANEGTLVIGSNPTQGTYYVTILTEVSIL